MKLHNARSPRNGILLPDDLPLFAFAAVRQSETYSLPLPAIVLSRRFGLTAERARVIAEQAEYPATGHTLHNALSDYGGKGNPELSARIGALGFPGIKYLDQGSRTAAGTGTKNYVVFDPSIVEILKRYGIPVTAGTVAAFSTVAPGKAEAGPVKR